MMTMAIMFMKLLLPIMMMTIILLDRVVDVVYSDDKDCGDGGGD